MSSLRGKGNRSLDARSLTRGPVVLTSVCTSRFELLSHLLSHPGRRDPFTRPQRRLRRLRAGLKVRLFETAQFRGHDFTELIRRSPSAQHFGCSRYACVL
jgi:hypothetical protein